MLRYGPPPNILEIIADAHATVAAFTVALSLYTHVNPVKTDTDYADRIYYTLTLDRIKSRLHLNNIEDILAFDDGTKIFTSQVSDIPSGRH